MAIALALSMVFAGTFVCSAQLQMPVVKSTEVEGELLYMVVNEDDGDVYLAVVMSLAEGSKIHRINGNLDTVSTTELPDVVKYMMIDNKQKSLIVCGLYRCIPYELATLKLIENAEAVCVFSSFESACSPTGSDIAAFFAGDDDDELYVATSPERSSCEVPRMATRKSALDHFLELLSDQESSDSQRSALFVSPFSGVFQDQRSAPDSVVYGFGHHGFSYFIGSLRLANGETEARVMRVCKSDMAYSSYMEVPLECEQAISSSRPQGPARRKRERQVQYRKTVTWAQMTTASQGLSDAGVKEGDYVLYYVMSRSMLCFVSMSDVEAAFVENIALCLEGGTMKSLAPDFHDMRCPRNTSYQAEDVVCDTPEEMPKFSGTLPIVGQAIRDIYDTVTASVVKTGMLSVLLHSDGAGAMRADVITLAVGVSKTYEDTSLPDSCQRPIAQFRPLPGNESQVITLQTRKVGHGSQEQISTVVTKALLANCSAYDYECSACLSVAFCGWCKEKKVCTLESHCSDGEWLQQAADTFVADPTDPSRDARIRCVYVDQIGEFSVKFYPPSGLPVGLTELTVNVTTEKRLRVRDVQYVRIYIGDDLRCNDVGILDSRYGFGSSRYSWTFNCSAISPGLTAAVPVSFSVYDFYPVKLWLNSSERFQFAVPTMRKFSPLKGPQAGGTLLEIQGTHLLAGNYREIVIGGRRCELRMDYSTNDRLVCVTAKVQEPTKSLVCVDFDRNITLTSKRRYDYTENPFIDTIYPLRAFLGGGAIQQVTGTNLDSIARPLFVVVVKTNGSYIDDFSSVCNVKNSTFMACPAPEIDISEFLNNTRGKREVGSSGCDVVARTPSGESVQFKIGFVLDGVQDWLPSVIDQHIDAKYTTIAVARDPVYYTFSGEGNILTFKPDEDNYLVIEGERLDCGATKYDITIEIGLAYCTPIISLYRTQLTCTPPNELPPVRSEYSEDHGLPHVLVRVGLASNRNFIGYIDYVNSTESEPGVAGWIIAVAAVCVIALLLLALAVVALFVAPRLRRKMEYIDSGVSGLNYLERKHHDAEPIPLTNVDHHGPSSRASAEESQETAVYSNTAAQELEAVRHQVRDVLIDSDRIRLQSGEILGRGHFGNVLYGKYVDSRGEVIYGVAVKSLKRYANIDDVRKFLEEGVIMKSFKHDNVLGLVGVCIDQDGRPMIVLPYMKNGDLKSFVANPDRVLTVRTLITYSLHVAQGMEYLSSMKFVHRDLAARNCMVDESETVKVSDFGLSRDIYEQEYYASEDKQTRLPIRWMPVESIKRGIFSTKTDVWSYGVLVWELITRGELPYASIDTWDIPSYLERGRRLPQPAYAPDKLYDLLLQCWQENPNERPEFGTLCQQLRHLCQLGEKATKGDENYYLEPIASPLYVNTMV